MQGSTRWPVRPLTVLAGACLCLCPAEMRAAPREATIFPDSAQVIEVSKVPLLRGEGDILQAIFILPGKADPRSLVVRLSPESRMKIDDLRHRQTTRRDDQKTRELQRQTAALREERNSLQAALQALESQLQFWQLQTKAKVKTIQDASAAAAVIGRNIKKTSQEKLAREAELGRLDAKLKELQDEAKQAADAKEKVWEFTVLVSGQRAAEATLTYSYRLTDCGWTPCYRLEAQPDAKRILYTREARIWQNSGQDWNGVEIALSTVSAPASGAAAEPPPWIVKPIDDGKGGAARPARPQVWKTGKRNLPSGSAQLVKLGENFRPASFVHLLKPSASASAQAVVRASLSPSDSAEIVPGKALLAVEGSVYGTDEYVLTGRETVIHFGPDALVSATRRLEQEDADNAAVPKGRTIARWARRVDVINSRSTPVRLQVEEPCPRPGNDRIKLTLKNEPETTTENSSSLIWILDLEAGQKKTLTTTVTIDAPEGMEIAPY